MGVPSRRSEVVKLAIVVLGTPRARILRTQSTITWQSLFIGPDDPHSPLRVCGEVVSRAGGEYRKWARAGVIS
jgi:hypothetical protein